MLFVCGGDTLGAFSAASTGERTREPPLHDPARVRRAERLALTRGDVVRSMERERLTKGIALMRGSYAEGGEGGPAFRVRAASTRLSCRVACLLARLQGRTLSGLVTGKRSAEQISRKYIPESWKTCRFSAAALRAVRSKRHPSMPFAWGRRAPRSFGPLRSLRC